MQVRVRLGLGIARFAPTPQLMLELPDGSNVEQAYEAIESEYPDLAPALRSALPVVAGRHAERTQSLRHGDELALLIPVAGGSQERVPITTRSSHGN
jgi:molybdopterin synthase sulfur carrier subunit